MRAILLLLVSACAGRDAASPPFVDIAAVPYAPLVVGADASAPPPSNVPVVRKELTRQPCSIEGSIASSASTEATALRFVNDTYDVVDVFWLDFDGARVLYNTLPAHESYVQSTYVMHPWLLVGRGGCLGVVTGRTPGEHRVELSGLGNP